MHFYTLFCTKLTKKTCAQKCKIGDENSDFANFINFRKEIFAKTKINLRENAKTKIFVSTLPTKHILTQYPLSLHVYSHKFTVLNLVLLSWSRIILWEPELEPHRDSAPAPTVSIPMF
jgi:hypothetical protein